MNQQEMLEKIKVVDITDVYFNDWNPKKVRTKEYEKVLKSVELNGLTQPIIVRQKDDGKYEVCDGVQRLTACIDLGYEKIMVLDLGKISDTEAKKITIWLQQQVPFDEEMLKPLLIELQEQIELPYSDEELEMLTGIELEEDDEDDEFDLRSNYVIFKQKVIKKWNDDIKDKIKRVCDDKNCSEGIALYALISQANVGEISNETISQLFEEESEEQF